MCSCLSHAPYWGPSPQPRLVPWLGIERVILQFIGQCSIHRATPARAQFHNWQWKLQTLQVESQPHSHSVIFESLAERNAVCGQVHAKCILDSLSRHIFLNVISLLRAAELCAWLPPMASWRITLNVLCFCWWPPQLSLRDIVQNMVCNIDAVSIVDIEDVTYVLSGLSMRTTHRSEFALWSHYLE